MSKSTKLVVSALTKFRRLRSGHGSIHLRRFSPDPDHLRVPIFTGSRRGGDHAYYIVAPGVDPAAFRQQLVAVIVSE